MKLLRKFMIGVGMLIMICVTLGQRTLPPKSPSPPLLKVAEAKAARVVKEFQSYELMGRRWRNIVIAPDPSLEALTLLAEQLHAEDPSSPFRIFTDGNTQQFKRFMLSDIHYKDHARYPPPKAWAYRHYIAMINQFGGNRRWQLQLFQGSGVKPPVQYGTAVNLE